MTLPRQFPGTDPSHGPPAEPPRWQLRQVFPVDPADLLDQLRDTSQALRQRYAGRVAQLTPAELSTLLDELGRVRDRISVVAAMLTVAGTQEAPGPDGPPTDEAGDPDGPGKDRVDVAQLAHAIGEAVEQIGFFDEEWLALDPDRAGLTARDPALAADRQLLRGMNRLRAHLLAPEAEALLSSRDESAHDAWIQLYRQTMAQPQVRLAGRVLSLDEAVQARRAAADRDLRHQAADALHAALAPSAGVVAACYDALVADRLAVDAVRGLDGPRQWTDLENDVAGARIDAMLAYVERHAILARQWFRRKAELLGLSRLTSVDEHVPLVATGPVSWSDAVTVVLDTFGSISPVIAEAATAVVRAGHIDAAPRVGKPANGFCFDAGRRHLPLISLSFTGQLTNVLHLAHELGHAAHFILAGRRQSGLSYDACTLVSETAATLLELAVRKRMTSANDDGPRLPPSTALQASIDSVFRQVMLTRFEERAYAARAEGERLTPELLTGFWRETNRALYGDALEVLPSFDLDWMRIEHFIQSRFYNYSYIAANLCGLAVGARLDSGDGDPGGDIVRFLSTGGAAGTAEQLRTLGLDLGDDELWSAAVRELDALLAVLQSDPAPARR